MHQSSAPVAPEPSESLLGRLLEPHRWLHRRRRPGEEGSAFHFGARLVATVILTSLLVGTVAYVLLERSLAQRQITDYAAVQRSDANAFENLGTRAASSSELIVEIDVLLDSAGTRLGGR